MNIIEKSSFDQSNTLAKVLSGQLRMESRGSSITTPKMSNLTLPLL